MHAAQPVPQDAFPPPKAGGDRVTCFWIGLRQLAAERSERALWRALSGIACLGSGEGR
jgi:hypothetical protein